MAMTIHVDIVSAETEFYSGCAEMVVVPGMMGDMGIIPRHTPLLTCLRPGQVRLVKCEGEEELFYAMDAETHDAHHMSHGEVVIEPGGSYFRFVKAIGVQPMCLSCHGTEEQIPAPVRAALTQDYSIDQATGYHAGELRGAVSIKQPIETKAGVKSTPVETDNRR